MLSISWKAAYNLIENSYPRRSLNKVIYGDEVGDNVFEASKLFAMAIKDRQYLDVMVKDRENLDKKYALFIDEDNINEPEIVLEKEKHLTLYEFALLSVKCTKVDPKKFQDIVESIAEQAEVASDPQKCINMFHAMRASIANSPRFTKN